MSRAGWLALVAVGLVLCQSLPARAVDDDDIKRAVERGVAALRRMQFEDGTWTYNDVQWTPGSTALAALALLECGADPATDRAVQKAANFLRENCIQSTSTYAISLCILFFDRLGEEADRPLIESLAVRLLAGQNIATGGWSYNCPGVSAVEARRLKDAVAKRAELVASGTIPKVARKREGWVQRDVREVPPEIREQLDQIERGQFPADPAQAGMVGVGDNSNTQFANLALWAAGRHGIPVEKALARVEVRYRASQNPDGGWAYLPIPGGLPPMAGGGPRGPGAAAAPRPFMPGMASTPAMTCAGLLGLATAHGAAQERAKDGKGKQPVDPSKDPNVKAGLLALGSAIDHPLGKPGNQGPGALEKQMMEQLPMISAKRAGQGYYFLWSLERVGVAYGLETIGTKKWYDYGVEILLKNQLVDGNWAGTYAAGGCDTSFALLFLRRANFTSDLTALLKDRVKDPGERQLRAVANIGDLQKQGAIPRAFDPDVKPGDAGGQGAKVADPRGQGGKAPTARPATAAPEPAGDPDVARLAAELIAAAPEQQPKLLEKLRDEKGTVYTDALAAAIPKLAGKVKTQARDALAERLTRMSPATLKDKLGDEDLEVRRAAALACAMKEEKGHIPLLIELLDDPEPPVARAAHAALKSLTNQDFGPETDATRADRTKAIAAWKAWWAKNGGK